MTNEEIIAQLEDIFPGLAPKAMPVTKAFPRGYVTVVAEEINHTQLMRVSDEIGRPASAGGRQLLVRRSGAYVSLRVQ